MRLNGGLAQRCGASPPQLAAVLLKALRQHMREMGDLSHLSSVAGGPVCEEPHVPDGDWFTY